MTFVYLIDAAGVLTGPVTLPVIPGLGEQLPGNGISLVQELKAPDEGHVWAFVDDEVKMLLDRRGLEVYGTSSGAPSIYDQLGDLPEDLTTEPRPAEFFVWSGDGWVLDEPAQVEAAQAIERAWRNAQISTTDYLAMPDYHLTAEQRVELYAYRQLLRDWPATGQFSEQQNRPEPPSWLAEQSQ